MREDIQNLLRSVIDRKPGDFSKAFDSIMKSKAYDIINKKRDEIVKDISGNK